ncbi:MAG: AIPR family protein [Dehalococcoidia bacterium]|nr:AIPR family protein [Dehalococcoidia bacterium]
MVRSASSSVVSPSPKPVRFKLAVHSFRNLRSPLNEVGVFRYWAIAPLAKLPAALASWTDVNPREPTTKGPVPGRIRKSLSEDPQWFELYSRGLSISASEVKYNNTTNEVEVVFDDREFHGVVDGLHLLKNVAEVVKDLAEDGEDVQGSITIEFVTGLPHEKVTPFSSARNTSLQVRTESLADQGNKFAKLKAALEKAGIDSEQISWHENDDGVMGVRELVALVSLFNRTRWNDTEHPLQAYYGKEITLKYFLNQPQEFEGIYPIVGDILRLQEWVQYYVPQQQIKNNSKFGHITGIRTLHSSVETLPFTGLQTEHAMPDAYVFPIVAAFRAMVMEKAGQYQWIKGIHAEQAVKEGLASEMFREGIFPTIQSLRNAMTVGKSPSVWGHCYVKGAMYGLTHKA